MGVYPKDYNRDSFLAFLHKNNVSDKIISKFNELPEIIKYKGHEYKLNIVSTWYSIGNTHYNFELNYYSEEIIEYLFSSKVFTDVEKSINYLLCELINAKFVEKQK
jgi:hypothetical protein